MENNGLVEINKNAFTRCKLREIYFSNNSLSFGDEKFSPFQHCKELKEMQLTGNNISKIYEDWRNNKILYRLWLTNNSLTEIKVKYSFFILHVFFHEIEKSMLNFFFFRLKTLNFLQLS